MGIAKGAMKVLMNETKRESFEGLSVLTLGRQDIWFSYDLLLETAKEFDVKLSNVSEITLSHNSFLADSQYISDSCFFQALGFSESKTMDYSDYEFADYILDLNDKKAVLDELCEAFDVIIDSGTIEHVFNIPNALNNIYKMLRKDGRIIHISPSSNHIDHGFYMFSPTLFWDFYHANKYIINTFQVFRYTALHYIDPWEISDYQSGCLDYISFGGLDDGIYGIICIATKRKESTGDIIPQQGSYVNKVWRKDKSERHQDEESNPEQPLIYSKYDGIKNTVKSIPLLGRLLMVILVFFRFLRKKIIRPVSNQKGLGLEVVERY